MTIHRETKAVYQQRHAVSASMCWDMIRECPAQAWFNSCFNPERPPEESDGNLEFGEIVHLAVLEDHLLADRVMIVDARDFRSKPAQQLRDQAYAEGKIPLLFESRRQRNSSRHGFGDVTAIRKALEDSAAASLLFGPGESEVSFTWTWGGLTDTRHYPGPTSDVACKARADRVVPGKLIDLKTADTANPGAFSGAIPRWGHHLRAAWYLDGWREATGTPLFEETEYLYVVVGKSEPHLVQTYRLDDRSLEWGRRLWRRALTEIGRARETGVWSGYGGQDRNAILTASLPAFAERQLADMEMEGTL